MEGVTRIQRLAALAALALLAAGCGTQRSAGPARSPAPTAPGAARASAATTFTLLATGDVLPHNEIIRQSGGNAGGHGHDFRTMFAGVKPVVSGADLAICHMETIYGRDGGPFTGYPSFKSPPEVAAALKDAGYDSCSTASNHTLDDGADGVRRTLGAMDAVGLRHTGSARSAAEAARPALLKAGPAKVAQLSYTYGTNGIPLPGKAPWTVNLIDRKKIIDDARAARRAGADVVVVSIHWGTEWQPEPDEQQRTLARALTASRTAGRPDIDLILGPTPMSRRRTRRSTAPGSSTGWATNWRAGCSTTATSRTAAATRARWPASPSPARSAPTAAGRSARRSSSPNSPTSTTGSGS